MTLTTRYEEQRTITGLLLEVPEEWLVCEICGHSRKVADWEWPEPSYYCPKGCDDMKDETLEAARLTHIFWKVWHMEGTGYFVWRGLYKKPIHLWPPWKWVR